MTNIVRLVPRQRDINNDLPGAPATVLHLGERAVYTVQEVSTLLSLSLGGTYALVRTGVIPARKLGGRWVIPKKRFHAWLDATGAPTESSAKGA